MILNAMGKPVEAGLPSDAIVIPCPSHNFHLILPKHPQGKPKFCQVCNGYGQVIVLARHLQPLLIQSAPTPEANADKGDHESEASQESQGDPAGA